MYQYNFPMPAVTATIAVIFDCVYDESVEASFLMLNAVRSDSSDAYPGYDSLPGGFLNAGKETVEQTAVRELFEETNLRVSENELTLFHVSSDPNTDPREHVVNVCYYVVLDSSFMKEVRASDDVKEITFRDTGEYFKPIDLAFNHLDIARRAISAARMDGALGDYE